ncbi:MAG: UDP-N-acetylglucosamine 2-epimerase (non-hydrolyzing) [Nannocystaceae bacterium]
MTYRIAVFVGTRPEAIKMAPVIQALQGLESLQPSAEVEPVVISTGQHREMLQQVVDIFDLPLHHQLDVMTQDQTLATLSARLMTKIDALLGELKPDLALVQGDTTTVLMAALACFYRNVPVGHVEAGLRTGNMRSPFPEEVNRRLVTPLADLHFAPTTTAAANLVRESVPESRIHVTGNTVIDALQLEIRRQKADPSAVDEVDRSLNPKLGPDWRSRPSILVTGHRRENLGSGFLNICEALLRLSLRFPEHRFIYPVHLNPKVQGPVQARLSSISNIYLLPPLSYRPFVALMNHVELVLTDSGGVQEEAPGLGKPVLVMRETTERPEGVEAGTVRLVGTQVEKIVSGVSELLTDNAVYRRMSDAHNPYGDGNASGRIVETCVRFLRDGADGYVRRSPPPFAA